MATVDMIALRNNLAKFIPDPRTIKVFEQAIGSAGQVDDVLVVAQEAQALAEMALALIELLSNASYVTMDANATLDSERVLTAGNLITVSDGGAGGNVTVALQSTTVGGNFVSLANPSAITFPRINANNSVSALDAAAFRTAIGAGTGAGSVTSVDISGGTTGLSATGGPISTAGVFTLSGTLDEENGGTGFSSYIAGDIIYAVSPTVLARLGVGLADHVLTSNGTIPGWTANTGTGNVARATKPQFTNTIGVGAPAVASGSGISFPATQSPSTDPNTFDDYAEGSWTPTVTTGSGAITSYAAGGYYTKTGRVVEFTIVISVTDNGTGGSTLSATLPFTAATGPFWVAAGRENSLTGNMLQGLVSSGSSTVTIFTYNNGYPGGTGATVIVTGQYHV